MYFDTHAHYDDARFDEDREALLAGLRAQGVALVLNAASDMASSEKAMALAQAHDFIYCSVGVHPHEAEGMRDEDFDTLRTWLKHPKVRALGEIGLDYYYDNSPREVQKKRFAEQLALAHELDVPVIIHERDAHEDCMNILRAAAPVRGVFHCYSGSLEMAKELVKRGFYLSFTGAITFKSARRALETIAWMPMERIMIETDCPYLTPVPFRGRRNDSSYVRLVAEKIAEVRQMHAGDVAAATMANGKRFFGITQHG